MSEQKQIRIQYEFGWETVEGLAKYDPETHELTMRIRPGGPVDKLLSGADQKNQIRALSFAWTPIRRTTQIDEPTLEEAVLDELERLSGSSSDDRLRDSIAMVRSALLDEIKARQ